MNTALNRVYLVSLLLLASALVNTASFAQSTQVCDISDEMQELLALHNLARAKRRQCGLQTFPSTSPLQWHCDLNRAARTHANDMAKKRFLSHRGSDKSTFTDRIERVNFDWLASAENIGQGFESVKGANSSLLESPQHCANIMNSEYQFFGAGHVGDYWAMLFAR